MSMRRLIENARLLAEGADTFFVESSGPNAKSAFDYAKADAVRRSGNRGYTGTIAEKDSFVLIDLPKGKDPFKYARELIDNSDARIDDKWGPAGAFDLGGGDYLFFGWAST